MSLYDVLGVRPTATDAEVRSAYKAAALRTHPDKGGTKEAFQRVQHAFAVLGDRNKRAAYDNDGPADAPPMPPDPEQAPPHQLDATLAEIFAGCEKRVKVKQRSACACMRTCGSCGGRGVFRINAFSMGGITAICGTCQGRGAIGRGCAACDQRGWVDATRELTVYILPGTPNGHVYLVDGVRLVLREQAVEPFTRVGHDLHMRASITLYAALTGFTLPLRHLDGRAYRMRYPDALLPCRPGTVVRQPGMGMPKYRQPGQRGDLVLTIDVTFPPAVPPALRAAVLQVWTPPPKSTEGQEFVLRV